MKSLEELNAIKQEYKSAVLIRTSDYGTRIIIGMGNSGIVAGARDILKTIVEEIDKEDLNGNVIVMQEARVSRVGCNPVVKIVEDGVKTAVYANVTSDMARRIIKEHIINGNIIEEYLLKESENKQEGKQ